MSYRYGADFHEGTMGTCPGPSGQMPNGPPFMKSSCFFVFLDVILVLGYYRLQLIVPVLVIFSRQTTTVKILIPRIALRCLRPTFEPHGVLPLSGMYRRR